MSCPEWRGLVAHRFDGGPPPSGWQRALAHAEACRACRERALSLDPTLVFRRLAAAPAATEEDAAFLEGLAARVAAARRARAIERSLESPGRGAVRTAVAGLVVVAALLLATQGGRVMAPEAGKASGPAARSSAPAWTVGALTLPAADSATPPLIEALDLPEARVYQLGQDEELSLVMIVDESLDV